MRQGVVATLRVRSWLVAGVLTAMGCSFDPSAIAPARDEHPATDGDDQDAAQRDARVVTTPDSSVVPPPRTDAGPQTPIRPPPGDPEPDAAPVRQDAASEDAAIDAAIDAEVDDEDAAVEEPDASEPCQQPDPRPCVCPHEPVPDGDACGPALCPIGDCAPDANCRFVAFASTGYYFCNDERTWAQARNRCESIADNAHLVSIDSAAEDQFVFEQIADKTWLGGNDGDQEGRWRWPDGTLFYDGEANGELPGEFNNWYANEPNNIGLSMMSEPDCLMYWHENATWADGSCGDPHGYACEID